MDGPDNGDDPRQARFGAVVSHYLRSGGPQSPRDGAAVFTEPIDRAFLHDGAGEDRIEGLLWPAWEAVIAAAIRSLRRGERPRPPSAGGPLGVAALTIVDGVDNLAAYTPFFATARAGQVVVTLAVFAAGVAIWCLAGGLLTRHARITAAVSRYGHWILPAALILIALYILHETNAPIF